MVVISGVPLRGVPLYRNVTYHAISYKTGRVVAMVTTARLRVDERVSHHDEKHHIIQAAVPGEAEPHLPSDPAPTSGRYQ